MEKPFMQAMADRFSCKGFDPVRKLREDDLLYILEAGRMSPSSIGLEQWKFIVVKSEDKKQELQHACWNQQQVGTAPVVVVILGRLAELHPDHPHIKNRISALVQGDEKAYEGTHKFYASYYEQMAENLPRWSSEQCHLAAANMMTAASVIGVDSCPIGGFVEEEVKKVLDIGEDYMVSLIIPFGQCANPGRPKDRLPLEEIVQEM